MRRKISVEVVGTLLALFTGLSLGDGTSLPIFPLSGISRTPSTRWPLRRVRACYRIAIQVTRAGGRYQRSLDPRRVLVCHRCRVAIRA